MSCSICRLLGVGLVTASFLAALPARMPAGEQAAPQRVGKLVASPEPLWPQWRGVRRDGVCDETGLIDRWPEGGPKVLWAAQNIGSGWSSPVLAGDLIYITGDFGEELKIIAIGLDGKERWRATNGKAWKGSYKGCRASCAISEGCLYHMNAHGRLVCLEAGTGKELWAVEVLERFGAKNIMWGISECLAIDGPRVIVSPGGPKTMMAALDKKTGKTVWSSEPIPSDKGGFDNAGYASPLLFELGKRRYLTSSSSRHAYAVDADTGKLLWSVARPTKWDVVAQTHTLVGDALFVSTCDHAGGTLYRLIDDDKGCRFEIAWETPLDNMHGCLVCVDGRIYGSGHQNQLWSCLDARTGKTLYVKEDIAAKDRDTYWSAMGSVIYADGHLYCLGEQGAMRLLRPTTDAFVEDGRFEFQAKAPRRHDVWAHPVICQGRLYLRYHDKLTCYDIRK